MRRMYKKKCHHGHRGHDKKTSQITVEAVTGNAELSFVE
jgi:hypothetical protein